MNKINVAILTICWVIGVIGVIIFLIGWNPKIKVVNPIDTLTYKVYYEYNVYNLEDTVPIDTVYIKIK
jgi:hypothetical protein